MRRSRHAEPRRTRPTAAVAVGYGLLELMIAMAIVMLLAGAAFEVLDPGQSALQAQLEVADVQQRVRVAAGIFFEALSMAAAPPTDGSMLGSLQAWLPAIVPNRHGLRGRASGPGYQPGAVTITSVPHGAPQSRTLDPILGPRARVRVTSLETCVGNIAPCAIAPGAIVLVFDGSGASDLFRVTLTDGHWLVLEDLSSSLAHAYPPGAHLTGVEHRTLYHDRETRQLRRWDGGRTDFPVVDDVVDVALRYFAGGPRSTSPSGGTARCPDVDGVEDPPAPAGAPVELEASALVDGPWCNVGGVRVDADLFRVRTVRVRLRAQAESPSLRGHHVDWFRRPGTAPAGSRMVRDLEVAFSVTPRHMEGGARKGRRTDVEPPSAEPTDVEG